MVSADNLLEDGDGGFDGFDVGDGEGAFAVAFAYLDAARVGGEIVEHFAEHLGLIVCLVALIDKECVHLTLFQRHFLDAETMCLSLLRCYFLISFV